MRKMMLGMLFGVFLFALSACGLAEEVFRRDDLPTTLMETRQKLRQGTVAVATELSNESFLPSRTATFHGSGVVYDRDGDTYYVLTNFHNIEQKDYDERIITIMTVLGEQSDAVLIHAAPELDLAVLSFTSGAIDIEPIDIHTRRGDSLSRREFVLSAGYPSELRAVVTYGEYLGMSTNDKVDFDIIAHSALIYPGNSGGALSDIHGNLVGINTWTATNVNERYFAIPLDIIHTFLEDAEIESGGLSWQTSS